MSAKVTAEHLRRGAVVYVRQSSPGQVAHHIESQRRQYSLSDRAYEMGFTMVQTIDQDLGRSGSGLVERPGFTRLLTLVCSGEVGAVFCLEAARLARNGRDWYHLLDFCALLDIVVIDTEGVYDLRLVNDRLLLGLKGTMSEYELTLLRERGLEAKNSKARRGELRFGLPAGYHWDELSRIQMDEDERVVEIIGLIFRKFRELGSARQLLHWLHAHAVEVPVVHRSPQGAQLDWCLPAYHNVLGFIRNPIYAGAYAFGRTGHRTRIADGRAVKTSGHRRPREQWQVLLPDHHPAYISMAEFDGNQRMLEENAHMRERTARKSGRGGQALLSAMIRCARCARMLRVIYGSAASRTHQYHCMGDQNRAAVRCLRVGGVAIDRAVSEQLLEAVAPCAVEAALSALDRSRQLEGELCAATARELEEARYEANLAERRYQVVDPDKRLVARELEARWEAALERVQAIETRLGQRERQRIQREREANSVTRHALLTLAQDLGALWNAERTDAGIKQRIVRILIREVVVDGNQEEVSVTIHWIGGRHTQVTVPRARRAQRGMEGDAQAPGPVEVLRTLAGHWPDHQLAVTLNRMRCPNPDSRTWTVMAVRELRERLGLVEFDPRAERPEFISADAAAQRLGISVSSVVRLIRRGVLPATQLMPMAPWQIPAEALENEQVRIGIRELSARRPRNFTKTKDKMTALLPGL
jgi:DNA invertase Pin-like site-specific DNA recombinase